MKLISELNDGERVAGQLLVSDVNKGTNANGSQYLSIGLQDNSGTINAKKWEINSTDEEIIVQGNIIYVEGETLKYKDSLQIKILSVSPVDINDCDLSKFVKLPPIKKEILIEKFNNYVSSIKNDSCKKLLDYFINKYKDKLFTYPAGITIHHDYSSGLLMHTVSMANIGDFLSNQYDVDRDLLMTGILLHDVGKVIEFEGPIVFKYSKQGKLLGHISIMASEIKQAAEILGLKDETPLLLQHMILSHHGEPEFGSPVLPCIKEALLLSLIDNLDSKMVVCDKALENVKDGEFSSKVFALDNRQIYKHK